MKESPSENLVTKPFREYRLPERDDLSRISELPRIETPLTEKSWDKIRTEWLRHERDKPLPSSTVEECIMEDGDFLIHEKRILNNGEKTIEFK